jgi:hypothetical protein
MRDARFADSLAGVSRSTNRAIGRKPSGAGLDDEFADALCRKIEPERLRSTRFQEGRVMPRTALLDRAPVLPAHHLAAQLHAGYSEQSSLYEMLLGVTSRQHRSLGDGGDLSEFVELTAEKDRLLGRINALDAELDPLRAQWMTAKSAAREMVAARLNPVFDEIIRAIQRTVAIEKDNERLLEARRERLGRLLAGARPWRVAASAARRPRSPAWASPVAAMCLPA